MLKSFNDLESGQVVHNHFEGKMTVSRLDFFHDGKEIVCLVDRKGMVYPAYQFSPDEWSLVTEDQREDCSSQKESNNEEDVSREDVENKIISLTKEIYDLYKKYNPKANYLAISVYDNHLHANNSYYDEDKEYPIHVSVFL